MPPKPRSDLPFLALKPNRDNIANALDFYADYLVKLGEEKDIRRIVEPDVNFFQLAAKQTREYADPQE